MQNIKELLYGRDSIRKLLDPKYRRALIITSPTAWKAVETALGSIPFAKLIMIDNCDKLKVEELIYDLSSNMDISCILGIGGGMVLDTAKYLSIHLKLPLTLVPTILLSNAFATEASGLRKKGLVQYLGKARMDVIIDFNLLRTAPAFLNASGIGDIISCHTARFDWACYDLDAFLPEVDYKARRLVDRIEDNLDEIASNSDFGLKILVDGLMETVEICQPVGHFRAEEGSEHYLFYLMENFYGKPYLHGSTILGTTYIMSLLQNNSSQRIKKMLIKLGVIIEGEAILKVLPMLKGFVKEQHFNKSVANETITEADISRIKEACHGLV
jgi:glycerol dehydrogenase-like iron-containing ADH family enzyme